jgi:hypothetical protein
MDFLGIQLRATLAIYKNGAPITATRTTGGTYNPGSSGITGATTSTFNTKGVISAYTTEETNDRNIVQGDLSVMLPATGYTPQEGDTVTISSSDYRVISVSPYMPGGVVLYNNVQVRK